MVVNTNVSLCLFLLQVDGCVKFNVNASLLMLSSRNFNIYNVKLTVDASVTEEATGKIQYHSID